jgi:hypothetical protein
MIEINSNRSMHRCSSKYYSEDEQDQGCSISSPPRSHWQSSQKEKSAKKKRAVT